MTRRIAFLAVALSISTSWTVQAAITNFKVVQVDNSAGGPELDGYDTFDVFIDFDGNVRGQEMILWLAQGSIYQNSSGLAGDVAPLAAFVEIDPAVAFDTFVTIGGPTLPSAGGLFASAGDFIMPGGAVDIGGTPKGKFDSTGINFTWAPAPGKNASGGENLQTARITLSKDAKGILTYYGSTSIGAGAEPFVTYHSFGNYPGPPPIIMDVDFGDRFEGDWMGRKLEVTGPLPMTIDRKVTVSEAPGPVLHPPIVHRHIYDSHFFWDSAGSPPGVYSFEVTASNHFGIGSGTLTVNLLPSEVVVGDALEFAQPGATVQHTFQVESGRPPTNWSVLTVTGPNGATPAHQPTINDDGIFAWDSSDSLQGTWIFSLSAASSRDSSDIATLTVRLGEVIPEPASWVLVLIAGLVGISRRRK